MFVINILNLFSDIPVLTNEGSGVYLEGETLDQSVDLLINSKRLNKINTPNHLSI